MPVDFEPIETESVAVTPRRKIDFQPITTKPRAKSKVNFEPVTDATGATLGDFMRAPDAAVTESSPLTQGEIPSSAAETIAPVPQTDEAVARAQVPPEDVPSPIGEEHPVELPRVGKPGTITRGVSDTLEGLAEWALNKPEEALATLSPLAPVIAAKYAPEVAMQFGRDVKEGLQGDREAIGRALTIAGLVAGPAVFKKVSERSIVEGKPGVEIESPQETALKATLPRPLEVPVKTEEVLPAATETLKEIAKAEPLIEKGVPDASKVNEAATLGRDVLRVREEARGENQAGVPVNEGVPGVRQEAQTLADLPENTKPIPELYGFQYHAGDFQRGLPVYSHPGAKSELARKFGIPTEIGSGVPGQGDYLLFVNERAGGSPVALWKKFEKPTASEPLQALPEPPTAGSEVKASAGTGEAAWFNASHNEYSQFESRPVEGVDSLGTWVTSNPQNARTLYGPNVHRVEIGQPRLLEFDGSDPTQIDFNRVIGSNATLARESGFTKEADILDKTIADSNRLTELERRFNNDERLNQQEQVELKQLRAADKASQVLLNSPKYMAKFRAMLEAEGYEGIAWKNSRIDTRKTDPPHDVAVIFNKSPLKSKKIKEIEKSPDAGSAGDVGSAIADPARVPEIGMGGAVPSEFTPSAGRVTGIKNASIDLQRKERGQEPIIKPMRDSDIEVWDRAMAKMDADYTTPDRLGVQDRLIQELREKPRAATPEEDVMLLQRMADYRNEMDRADAARKLAEKDGRILDAEAAEARADEWNAKLNDLEAITELSGSASGSSLRARRFMMNADYSLAAMERTMRKAGSDPLSKAERDAIAKDHATIEALRTQLKEREAKLAAETEARVKAELNVTPDGSAKIPEHIMRIVRKVGEVLDKRADAARIRLRGKVFTLSPELLKDLAEVGASNIYHIGLDTAKWSARMIEELGEQVRPHLDAIFEAAKKLVDATSEEIAGRKPRVARKVAVTAVDPEAQRLATWKKRTVDSIVKLEERIAKDDLSKRTRIEVKLDEEGRRLAFELHEAKRKFNAKVFEKKLREEGPGAKAMRRLGEASNTARSVLGSVDLSAVLRQGKFAVLAHPIIGARSLKPMIEAALSEKRAFEIDREIATRPNAARAKRAGLAITEADYTLSKMEEQFMGRWAMDPLHFANKIAPRLAEFARKVNPVAASARAYQVFLNKVRADSFDVLVEGLERKGGDLAAQDKVIAQAVNVFTGRGSLGKAEAAAQALNTWFWAPKFVASRFQALLGQPLWQGKWRGTAEARKIIAMEYAKILTAYGVIFGLAKLAGVKVGTDPDSSDFGKLIFGKTRLDLLAGVSQASVFINRVARGTTTTLSGKHKNLRGNRKYGDKDVPRVIWDFGRSKLAPLPGSVLDFVSGEDFLGRPVTPKSMLVKYTVPISLQDIADTMKEQGVPAGTAFTLLSIMGENVTTYDDWVKSKKR